MVQMRRKRAVRLTDDVFEDVPSDMGVHSTQRVVKQNNVCMRVHSPCEGYTLFLATGQVDALKWEPVRKKGTKRYSEPAWKFRKFNKSLAKRSGTTVHERLLEI